LNIGLSPTVVEMLLKLENGSFFLHIPCLTPPLKEPVKISGRNLLYYLLSIYLLYYLACIN